MLTLHLERYDAGASNPTLNRNHIHKINVFFPPLPIQREIAAILSAYDDLIENNTRRIQILEEMAQNIYREWFVHFRFPGHESVRMVDSGTELGNVPEEWGVSILEEIVSNIKETTKSGNHLSGRKYLPINLITPKSLALKEFESWENAKSSLILFQESDILFGAMRPYLYKVAIAPFLGVTRSTCFVLRPREDDYYSYAVMTMFQDSTIEYSDKHSRGTTIPYAAWEGSLSNMPILLPPIYILRKFNEIVKPMLDYIQTFMASYNNLSQTRDFLLPKLVSGQIDVSKLDII